MKFYPVCHGIDLYGPHVIACRSATIVDQRPVVVKGGSVCPKRNGKITRTKGPAVAGRNGSVCAISIKAERLAHFPRSIGCSTERRVIRPDDIQGVIVSTPPGDEARGRCDASGIGNHRNRVCQDHRQNQRNYQRNSFIHGELPKKSYY